MQIEHRSIEHCPERTAAVVIGRCSRIDQARNQSLSKPTVPTSASALFEECYSELF